MLDKPRPKLADIPNDDYGDAVRLGHELMTRTYAYLGPEVKDKKKRYAGNNFSCTTCHLEEGTKAYSNPWVAVYPTFPVYRGRENSMITVEDRINACFERSMNGKPIPYDSTEMRAMVAYIHFLGRGIPVGSKVEGRGIKQIDLPNRAANPEAGKQVYDTFCGMCHGVNGEGRRNGVAGDLRGYAIPPVWGPDTYVDGAGINRVIMGASWIRYNMPLGVTYRYPMLSNEQAYDVAAFLASKPHPKRPHLERDYPLLWNKLVDAPYPPYPDDAPAIQHRFGPFQPLIDIARVRVEKHKAEAAARRAAELAK